MKEIICRTQKELDAAVKLKDVEIIIRDTTEWLSVSGNATIQSVYGNATIKIYSAQVTIESCCLMAVIIMIGCVCQIKKKTKSVTVIKNKVATYNKKSFCQIYQENMIDKTTIKLYKSVRKDNHKDFYTNSIEYKGEVTCPDFKENKEQECGNGLHLSPLPHLALSYNEGLLLECAVKLWDFVVYPQNITKVRCQKVTVLGEYKK